MIWRSSCSSRRATLPIWIITMALLWRIWSAGQKRGNALSDGQTAGSKRQAISHRAGWRGV